MKTRNSEVRKFPVFSGSQLLSFSAAVIILSFLCIAVPVHGAGSDILWQYGAALAGRQEAKAMAVDASGNVVITGFRDGGGGNNDFHTVKILSNGSGLAWPAVSYDKAGGDDQATAVAADNSGNIIVTGFVQSGLKFDIQTIKYDGANGNVLWQRSYNGAANGNDEASSVAVDGFNNVYVAGHIQNASGNDDYILLKYDPDGNLLWQETKNGAGNGQDRITSVTAGADGVAVTGYSWNGTDFDYLTIKYGFDSSLIWEKSHSSAGARSDWGLLTKMDSSGNVVVTGYVSNASDKDIYTIKYGPDGTKIMDALYNGGFDDEPRGLWIGVNGNIYITGYTWTLAGHYDFYTAKYHGTTGALLWDEVFNSGTDNDDIALGIIVDGDRDVFVTGYTSSSGNYDFRTVKYQKDSGALLWQANFDGAAGRNDRPAGIGLSPSGEVIVAGWSDMWTSGASDYDYYAVQYDPGILNGPTNLSAETVSTTSITLTWTDNSANEDGFRIERKIGELGVYEQIATVPEPLPADTVTYTDTGLNPDTRYYYRVRAFSAAAGNSLSSNEASAVTILVTYAAPGWSFTYDGGGGDDYAMAVSAGPDRHPVVTGYSFTAATSFDYYTLKLDRANGSVLWSARYDDPDNDLDAGMCVSVDRNNEAVVSGYSSLYSAAAGQNTNDVYTIKYRSTGEPELWHDAYDGPVHNDDRSTAVSTSADGSNNIVVAGYGRNAAFDDDIYLIKYRPDGSRAWVATPYNGGGNDYPSAVTIDLSDNIYVTGYTHNGANYDFFTRKYDSSGNIVWTDIFPPGGGNGNDVAKALSVDSAGNLYVTGSVMNASGNQDFYTIKYDGATGARIWERSFDGAAHGNDQAVAVSVDPIDGECVVSGSSLTGTGDNDYHVIRYDPDGNVVWQKTLQRPANDDYVVAMGMDLSGNVCVAGNTHNGSNLDVMSIKYTFEGNIIGATVYNGTANDNDTASAVAVNSLGEAFIAGESINSSGNADYLVFKCAWDSLQVPAPFTATAAYTEVVLTWQDNSGTEDGFHIQRKDGPCTSANAWALIHTALPDETSHTDKGLNVGQYCYRIQAYQNNGEASRWLEATATTSNPPAPADLVATAVTTTQINLSWTDTTAGETGFRIERCAGSGCSDFSEIATVGSAVTTYRNAGLSPSAEYSYRIRAYKAGSWLSAYSNTANAATVVNAPSGLTAVPENTTQVKLSWTDNNVDETGFVVERCEGSGCSSFSGIGTAALNATSYTDTTVCSGTTYVYRVRADNGSLSNRAGGCWSRRAPLTITGFLPDYAVKVTIPYDPDMQNDFDDIRFYDDAARAELPYYLESKTDGVSATVWVKTGASDNIFLYYGNASATSSSNGNAVFEFFDDFRGGAIDNARWTEIDPNNSIYQNNDLILQYINSGWTKALISGQTITRAADKKVTMKVRPGNGASGDYFMAGWATNQTTDPGIAQQIHGLYWNNFLLSTYEKGSHTGPNTQAYAAGTEYEMKIELKTAGAKYFIKGGAYADWTLVKETSTHADSPMRIAVTQQTHAANIHLIMVQSFAATEPSAAIGAEEQETCYLSPWVSAYSNEASAATPAPVPPGLTAARISEVEVGLTWTDNTTDETSYEVLRCTGSGCTPAEPAFAVLSAGAVSFNDKGLSPSTIYRYLVQAKKTAACGWTSPSVTGEAETTIVAPGGLAALPQDTTTVALSWTDTTASETGFEIERCEGASCDFSVKETFAAPAGAMAYTDTSVCHSLGYRYRVKALKEVFSASGSGCWSRRAPLTVTGFQPNFQARVMVAYDPDMQPDFDDIRFYDAVAGVELPYWIEQKSDGLSATVWVRTGANNSVFLYYGNPKAAGTGNGNAVFEFFDDFNGAGIDASKWTVGTISATSGTAFSQSSGYLRGGNNNRYVQSASAFTGSYVAEARVYEAASANNGFMTLGFQKSSSDSFGIMAQNGTMYIRTDASWPTPGAFPAGKWSRDKVIAIGANSVGSRVSEDGTSSMSGTYSNSGISGEYLRLGARYDNSAYNQNFDASWDWLFVRKYAASEPSVTVGAEEILGTAFCPSVAWSSPFSNEAAVTMPTPVAPASLVASPLSESQVSLVWSDVNTDETGFIIERKAEACSASSLTFAPVLPVNDAFMSGIDSGIWSQRGILYDSSGAIAQDITAPPVDSTDANGTVRVGPSAGAVELLTASTGGGTAGSYNNSRISLIYPGTVQGNFDIQIDYSLPDGQITSSEYHVYARLLVTFPNTTNGANNVYVERAVSSSGNYYYGAVRIDGTAGGVSLASNDTSGKLRIRRTGGVISTYAWTGAAWTLLKESSGASTLSATNIVLIQYVQRNEARTLRCLLDNFAYSAASSSFTDTGLASGMTYCYRVAAYKTAPCGWTTAFSNEDDATTLAPPAPSNLTATGVSTTQVDLKWDDNTGTETNFVIQRCTGAGCSDFADIATVNANVTTWSDSTVCTGSVYQYRVRATKTTDPIFDTAYSNTAIGVPRAVGNRLTDPDFENATTGWTTAVGTTTGTSFDALQYYAGGKSLKLTATGATLGRSQSVAVSAGKQYILSGYLNASLTAGRVQCDVLGTGIDSPGINIAFGSPNNNAGWVYLTETVTIPGSTTSVSVRCFGDGSPQGTAYFDAIQFAPDPAVANLTATRSSEIQINLAWPDYMDDETGFEILRCAGAGCTPSDPPVAAVGANVTAYNDLWLTHSSTYRYVVRAYKSASCAWSSSSPVAEAVTSISAPTALSASAANTTQVNLGWNETTASETRFTVQRCTGSGCSDFATIGYADAGQGTGSYQDTSACEGTAYRYRVGARSDGLSKSGGGCWTRRVPVTITDFTQDFLMRLTVPYDADMQPDFDDLRFFDDMQPRELPYWIESKTDGVSATVWIKTGSNNAVHLYYGNPAAAASGSMTNVFGTGLRGFWQFNEAAGTIAGTTADISGSGNDGTLNSFVAPYGIVGAGKFGNALSLNGTGNYVSRGTTNLPTGNTASIEAWVYPKAYADASYNGIVSWGNRTCNAYAVALAIQNTGRPSMATWCNDFIPGTAPAATLNAWNHIAVVVSGTNVTLYMNGQPSGGTLTYTPNIQQNNLSIGALDYPGRYFNGMVDEVRIYNRALTSAEIASRYAATEPAAAYGAEESSGCFTFANGFDEQYSSPSATVTTPVANAPALSGSRGSEIQVNLNWTDTNSDETGFKVYRCEGSGCTPAAPAIATLGPGVTGYEDGEVLHSRTYRYQVSAYKTASCAWEKLSTPAEVTTSLEPPSGLTATPVNTTQIDLSWTDRSGSETSFRIERCEGSGCSGFTDLATVGPDTNAYADTSVCNSTSYTYRVTAVNDGLSNSGGGCWTRKVPLTVSGFQKKYATRMTVLYDADMQPDFDDLRFYDEAAQAELPYWIESRTDGVSAVVWLMPGYNSQISLYYGNPAAAAESRQSGVFEFFDSFRGTSMDTAKWAEIDPDNSIAQNNDLILNDVSDTWTKALISSQTFTRVANRALQVQFTVPADTPGNNHVMFGWEANQNADPNYSHLVHGLYLNNYLLTTYEKNTHTGPNTQPYAASTDYEVRIILKAAGASYYIKGGAYADWTQVVPSTVLNYADSPLRVAFTQYSHQLNVHRVSVVRQTALPAVEPSVAFGAEETAACYAFVTWSAGPGITASATTPAPVAPSGLAATAMTDALIDLAWTDGAPDETGFRVERCSPAGCSDFAEIGSVGPDVRTYQDPTVLPSTDYCYRVRAYKTASCGWNSGYSGTACDLVISARPISLIAAPENPFKILLNWSDVSTDEDGFEVEVQIWNGRWVSIGTTGPGITTYLDTAGIEPDKEYTYRVRAFRGEDRSPYSNEASAKTPVFAGGANVCP